MKFLALALLIFTHIGDYASYSEMDSCTSSFIKSIDASLEVVGERPDAYQVELDYKFKFQFGSHSDDTTKWLDRYYFTEQFLIDMRRDKYHEGEHFKARHDGYDGTYDYIHFYDIDGYDGTADAKIRWGLPVLGIYELETRGKLEGMSFKACVDLD